VIHELTHNKFYAKGQAVFNESFASFVGARGAQEFFTARGDSASARRVVERWGDDLLLGAVWERTFRALDSAYAAHASDSARAERLAARDTIYARAHRLLVDSVASQLKSIDPRYAERVRLDNAALLARRIYSTGLDGFEKVWTREDRSVRKALERIIALAKANPRAPGAAVDKWLGAAP
jgi:predicted aminopeptidase